MVESFKIVALGVVAAVAYGIAHDNVTARVCVEYFTIGHVRVIDRESPTLLALTWGVIATWWVGFGLGLLLAVVCRSGRGPKLGSSDLLRPVGRLLATMAVVSTLAGFAGHFAASRGWVQLDEWIAEVVPEDKHVAFLADLWAHRAAYASAFLGGIVLAAWTVVRRSKLARAAQAAGV